MNWTKAQTEREKGWFLFLFFGPGRRKRGRGTGPIRLVLAFRGEEPGGYGGEDDDHEADDDTPAVQRKED